MKKLTKKKAIVRALNAAAQRSWNPSRCIGYSAEQIALIEKGFNMALNDVYLSRREILRQSA